MLTLQTLYVLHTGFLCCHYTNILCISHRPSWLERHGQLCDHINVYTMVIVVSIYWVKKAIMLTGSQAFKRWILSDHVILSYLKGIAFWEHTVVKYIVICIFFLFMLHLHRHKFSCAALFIHVTCAGCKQTWNALSLFCRVSGVSRPCQRSGCMEGRCSAA